MDSFGELPRSSETLKKHIDRGFAEASTGPIDRDLGSFAECLGSSETCHETNIVIIATLFYRCTNCCYNNCYNNFVIQKKQQQREAKQKYDNKEHTHNPRLFLNKRIA